MLSQKPRKDSSYDETTQTLTSQRASGPKPIQQDETPMDLGGLSVQSQISAQVRIDPVRGRPEV